MFGVHNGFTVLSHNDYDFVFFVDDHFVIPLAVFLDIFSCYEFSGHPDKLNSCKSASAPLIFCWMRSMLLMET